MGDPEEAPGSRLQSGSDLDVAAIWKVNQHWSVSLPLPGPQTLCLSNKIFKRNTEKFKGSEVKMLSVRGDSNLYI